MNNAIAKFKLNEDIFIQRISVDSDNNRVIVGFERDNEEDKVLISKYDAEENILWQKKLDSGSGDERFYAVVADSSISYVAVGNGFTASDDNNDEALIVKFSKDGSTLWQKS